MSGGSLCSFRIRCSPKEIKSQFEVFYIVYICKNGKIQYNKIKHFCLTLSSCLKMKIAKSHLLKGALSGLRQSLIAESLLKMMKNALYFTSRALSVLKIFKFFS